MFRSEHWTPSTKPLFARSLERLPYTNARRSSTKAHHPRVSSEFQKPRKMAASGRSKQKTVYIDLESESDDSEIEFVTLPLPQPISGQRSGHAEKAQAAEAGNSAQSRRFQHDTPSARMVRENNLKGPRVAPNKLAGRPRKPHKPSQSALPKPFSAAHAAHGNSPQQTGAAANAADSRGKYVAEGLPAASGGGGSCGCTSVPAARLFEMCADVLRAVKGRALTAWSIHAALPHHVDVPLAHVTKVMLAACSNAARPHALQQHKPPVGKGGHLSWSWAQAGAPQLPVRVATPVKSSVPHRTAPSATASAATEKPPAGRVGGTKRQRPALKQADLLASTAAELGNDLNESAQRIKQANRIRDFVAAQAAAQQQREADAGRLKAISGEELSGMSPSALLAEFQRRYDKLDWQQRAVDAPSTPRTLSSCVSLLGLATSTSAAECKKRFRTLARVFHPDKCRLEGALEIFLALQQAASMLEAGH